VHAAALHGRSPHQIVKLSGFQRHHRKNERGAFPYKHNRLHWGMGTPTSNPHPRFSTYDLHVGPI